MATCGRVVQVLVHPPIIQHHQLPTEVQPIHQPQLTEVWAHPRHIIIHQPIRIIPPDLHIFLQDLRTLNILH